MNTRNQAIESISRLENKCLIDGKLSSPKSKKNFPVTCSATGEIIGYAPRIV